MHIKTYHLYSMCPEVDNMYIKIHLCNPPKAVKKIINLPKKKKFL